MAEMNSSNIGFEKQIWDAACVLRGNMDASEYKSVVLGLIFLKYISDRFDAKHKELVDEGAGFEEDMLQATLAVYGFRFPFQIRLKRQTSCRHEFGGGKQCILAQQVGHGYGFCLEGNAPLLVFLCK